MPYQDLSVGSTSSSSSSSSTSGLGAKQNTSNNNNNNDDGGSWWDSVKSYFSGSGGDSSNVSSPEESSNKANTVNFSDDDDNTNAAASVYDEPEMTYEPEVYAAITDAGTAGVFYTPDDIIQEAYEGDMAGKGEDKPDPLGNMGVPPATLKDVTDTDEGALSNPDPLYKMAEEVRTPTITTTVLDDEGKPTIDFNKITNIQDVRSDSALDNTTDYEAAINEALDRVYGESDPETGQKIKSADDVMSDMASQGLMSPRLDGKDGTIVKDQTFDFDYETTSNRLVKDLVRDLDLSVEQASAIAGNLAVETGNFSKLQEVLTKERKNKGHKGGRGFAQWTDTSKANNRRTRFESWSLENGLDPNSYEANYGYLLKELTTTDPVIGNIGKNTIKKIKKTDNVEDAAEIVSNYFLRPGIPHLKKRKDRAKEIYARNRRMYSPRPVLRPTN